VGGGEEEEGGREGRGEGGEGERRRGEGGRGGEGREEGGRGSGEGGRGGGKTRLLSYILFLIKDPAMSRLSKLVRALIWTTNLQKLAMCKVELNKQ
jgi:hypothetical protein